MKKNAKSEGSEKKALNKLPIYKDEKRSRHRDRKLVGESEESTDGGGRGG